MVRTRPAPAAIREAPAGRPLSVSGAVLRFAVSSLIAFGILAGVGLYVLDRATRNNAVDEAARITQVNGHGIVEPALTSALLRGDPRAVARIDRLVRARVLHDPVMRVKIWRGDGTVVYSDEPREIGTRYPLAADELGSLRTGHTDAEVASLDKAENRFERRRGRLLEVYLPVRAPGGRSVLFESYLHYASVTGDGRALLMSLAPVLLGALLLLCLAQLPLAYSLARRVRAGQQEREELLVGTLEASERERRRIAQHLHDGPVQSLAGVSFSLSAAAGRADARHGAVADVLRDAAAGTRQSIRELRTLLVDIYPPDLHRAGLVAALRDLLAPLGSHGVEGRLTTPPELDLPPATEALLFRTAQEALRNVLAHADATTVDVIVAGNAARVTITIADDGVGFDPGGDDARPEGHFGLRVLAELAREAGGALQIISSPGAGTIVRAEVPSS